MPKQKTLKNFKVAKGHTYKPGKWPKQYANTDKVYLENKFDGLRGNIIVRDGVANAYTSSGVLVPNAVILCKAITKCSLANNRMLDGEFFAGTWNLSTSLVKTQELLPERGKLQFRVFDTVTLKEFDARQGVTPYHKRKENARKIVKKVAHKNVILLGSIPIEKDPKSIMRYMSAAAKAGHEGIMIKDPNHAWVPKRSANWLKAKPFQEGDFKIVGAELGAKGKANAKRLGKIHIEGRVGKVKVKTRCGGGFKAFERDKLWKMFKAGKLVGRVAMIEHEGVTIKGALRFPQFIRLHEEK